MARAHRTETSDFYCTSCGGRGIPLARSVYRGREAGHLKRLHCVRCGRVVNHAEVREGCSYTHDAFAVELEVGNFDEHGMRIFESWRAFCGKAERGELRPGWQEGASRARKLYVKTHMPVADILEECGIDGDAFEAYMDHFARKEGKGGS